MVKTVKRPVASTVLDMTNPVTGRTGHVTRAVSLATMDGSVLKVNC